jgi:hypothetical protein
LRELERVAQRLAGVGPFGDWGEVENGERNHAPDMVYGPASR